MMDLTFNMDKVLRVTDDEVERSMRHYGLRLEHLEQGLNALWDWYKLQPHLPQGALCDRKLTRHFMTCGFSIEKTKRNLDSYYSARTITPEFTTNRDPVGQNVEDVFQLCLCATFPQQTEEQFRVTFIRLRDGDVTKWRPLEAFKLAFMVGDYRLMNDTALGDHFIVDFKHITIAHVKPFTPSFIAKIQFYLQRCMGAKIKGIHLIGLPSYAEVAIGMFKRALSRKVAERFFTYNNVEQVMAQFPRSMVPKDLGGDDISTDQIMENWKETLQSTAWRKWFSEQENIKSDESKRDRNSSSPGELLGIHGSFRKLDVD